jgi:hypothetical protein
MVRMNQFTDTISIPPRALLAGDGEMRDGVRLNTFVFCRLRAEAVSGDPAPDAV